MTKPVEPGTPRDDLIVDPLDYLILEQLPIEGTLIFGAYPDGRTANEIAPKIGNGQVGTGSIGARLGVLGKHIGWTVKQKGIGTSGKWVWQRTKAGDKALQAWRGESYGDES